MEFYHNQFNLRVSNDKDPAVYQRTDWLVDKLGTKVHSYFWLDEYSGKDDFARYWKDEWVSGLTSWRKALKIPDSDVIIEGRCAKVTEQLDRDRVYVVWNPGSQFGICDCSWAEMGYLCEHVFKVIKVLREKGSILPSLSLFQYNKALTDMLHCAPHDSLIRDHAVSLALFVQKQLSSLVSPIQNTRDDIQQGSEPLVSAKQSRGFVDKGRCGNGTLLSNQENCSEAPAGNASDLGSESVDRVNGEATGEGISGSEMDVGPPSIISPPELLSLNEVVAANALSEHGDSALCSEAPHLNSKSPHKDHSLRDQNGYEEDILNKACHESVMALEPQPDEIPPTGQIFNSCTATHQDSIGSKSSKPSVASMSIPEEGSPSITVPVKSQELKMAEASGAPNLDMSMASDSENDITNKIHFTDTTLPSDGNHVNPGDEAEAVDIIMAEDSENHSNSELVSKVAAQETDDSGEEKLLTEKPSTAKSKHEKSVEEVEREICRRYPATAINAFDKQ